MTELLILQQDCEQATKQVAQALTGCGLKVVRSFDLRHVWRSSDQAPAADERQTAVSFYPQAALTPPDQCGCPHHGTAPCNCQMVVMLIYGTAVAPATLVAHGHDGTTWFTLVDTPEQRPSPYLATAITAALQGNLSLLTVSR